MSGVQARLPITESFPSYYQHGWQSWSVTGWRPHGRPMRHPVVPAHAFQSTDPQRLSDTRVGGASVGAVDVTGDTITLLGSVGPDGWVALENEGMVGEGPGPWFEATGAEQAVFAAYAERLGETLGRRTGTPGPIWCSWYGLGRDVDEPSMARVLEGIDDLPFAIVQIDDGWQRSNGDWEANEDFPNGMRAIADLTASTGRTPGLWLAPLLVDSWSDLASRHPEMLLRDSLGAPIVAAANWGGPTWALDVRRADVRDWLGELVTRVVDWGFRYLKLDFLYAGALMSDDGREASYRSAVQVIRDAVGDEVYLLACGAPVVPSLGVFDAIRVGPDVAPYWDDVNRTRHLADRAGPGTADAIATSLGRLWLRSVIDVDPDVAFFRSRYCLLTRPQKQLLVDLAHICDFRATSDPPWWLDREERDEMERFLRSTPAIERKERFRFVIDGRDVDFGAVVEGRPW